MRPRNAVGRDSLLASNSAASGKFCCRDVAEQRTARTFPKDTGEELAPFRAAGNAGVVETRVPVGRSEGVKAAASPQSRLRRAFPG